jgi:hypothetical protein
MVKGMCAGAVLGLLISALAFPEDVGKAVARVVQGYQAAMGQPNGTARP